MADVKQILNDLYSIRRKGYGNQLPGPYDLKFIELAEHYAKSETKERASIRGNIKDESRLLLIGFSDRLAIIADRTSNKKLLMLALIAHSIEDFSYDNRENIFRLALVNHVAEKLNAHPNELFEKVACLSSPKGASTLRAFNSRPSELKSLHAMGIIEEQTEAGTNYCYR